MAMPQGITVPPKLKNSETTTASVIQPRRLIGVHLSTAGGVASAVRRAPEVGANTLQIFSSSPRMWRASKITPDQASATRAAREELGVGPLVIHTSYLVNLC